MLTELQEPELSDEAIVRGEAAIQTWVTACNEFDDTKTQADTAQRAFHKAQIHLIESVRDVLHYVPKLVDVMYWDFPMVPVRAIAEGLDVPVTHVSRFVDPRRYADCEDCGNPINVRNRTELAAWRELPPDHATLCPDCKKHRDREYAAEVRQANAEYERNWPMRLELLRTMPYREYLLTPEWEATRKRALKRAEYRCQLCSKAGRLHVHHRTYERRGWENNEDLIVLCPHCHAKFHDKLPQPVDKPVDATVDKPVDEVAV